MNPESLADSGFLRANWYERGLRSWEAALCLRPLQADLVFLHFPLCFTAIVLFLKKKNKNKLNVCGNTMLSKSIDTIFPTIFAHSVSLFILLVLFQTFS